MWLAPLAATGRLRLLSLPGRAPNYRHTEQGKLLPPLHLHGPAQGDFELVLRERGLRETDGRVAPYVGMQRRRRLHTRLAVSGITGKGDKGHGGAAALGGSKCPRLRGLR